MAVTDFKVGDLVLVETGHIESLARVRSCSNDRLHLALENGAFIPWTEEPVTVRRCNDLTARAYAARIVHASTATATLDVVPEANDTERDLAPPSVA